MASFYEPPVNHAVAAGLVIFGAWAGARGARRVSDGLASGAALELVRGLRLAILAIVAGFFAVGLVSARSGFVTFGALILAEELYETGLLALLCRLGEREAGAGAAGVAAGQTTRVPPAAPEGYPGSAARATCSASAVFFQPTTPTCWPEPTPCARDICAPGG